VPVRVLTLRVAVIGRRPKLDLAVLRPGRGPIGAAARGTRQVWFDGKMHDAQIFDRLSLPENAEILGPAILEQPDATTWIDPDLVGRVDTYGNVVISRKAKA
jgi:N-methylhydantoinase A